MPLAIPYTPVFLRRTLGRTFDMYRVLADLDPIAAASEIEQFMKTGGAPASLVELQSRVYLAVEEKLAVRLLAVAEGVRAAPCARPTAWTTSMLDHISKVIRKVLAEIRVGKREIPSAKEFDNFLRMALRLADLGDAKTRIRKPLPTPASQLGDGTARNELENLQDSSASDSAPKPTAAGDRRAVVDALVLLDDMAKDPTVVGAVAGEMFQYIVFANGNPDPAREVPRVNVRALFDDPASKAQLAELRKPVDFTKRELLAEEQIRLQVFQDSIRELDGFAVWYGGGLLERGAGYGVHAGHLKRFREAVEVRVSNCPEVAGAWLVRAIADGETLMHAFARSARGRWPSWYSELDFARIVRSLFAIETADVELVRGLEPVDHAFALRLRKVSGPSNLAAERLNAEELAADLRCNLTELAKEIHTLADRIGGHDGAEPWIGRLLGRAQLVSLDPIERAGIATLLWRIAAADEQAVRRLAPALCKRAQDIRAWLDSADDSPLPMSAAELREVGTALNADPTGGWQIWCELNRALLGKEQFKLARPGDAAVAILEAIWILQTAEASSLRRLDPAMRRVAGLVRGGSLESCIVAAPTERTVVLRALLPAMADAGLTTQQKRKQTEDAKKALDAELDGMIIRAAEGVGTLRTNN